MSVTPNFTEFKKSAKRHNVVALSIDLAADLETPVSVFQKLASDKKHAFLLESVELGEKLGRFSLIGMDPEAIIEYSNNQCVLFRSGAGKVRLKGDLLDVTQKLMKHYTFAPNPKLPPLVGGFVGYIGYELVQQFEDITLKKKQGLQVPDSVLFLPTNLIVFDHIKHELKLIHLAIIDGSVKSTYQKAVQKLHLMTQQLKKATREKLEQVGHKQSSIQLRSNVTQTRFESMVRRAKEHIRAGDCIQIVLSQRFTLGRVPDDFKLYRILRSLNPSPYLFYFRHQDLSLVGSSPEMLAKKTGRKAEIRPIAGTRPRGETEEKDLAFEAALKASPKEMAEHLMLVDLGRNDLGRVSDSKSVRVQDFARVERYSHVMHLVSDVEALLKQGKTAFDLLKASFPAGTVAGAPKIRAMQIIDELEPERRGPYAGSLGYFSLTGDMDMCITIRTIVVHKKQAYVQAGAGIVMDSVPRKEYQETINKAKALFQAVEKTRES
jgi:anthranilate synthase component 1